MKPRVFTIAEAGVNHNGSLETARQLIDAAAAAGADAVKFQTFRAREIARHGAPKAQYQMQTTAGTESQYEMLRRLELDESQHEALIAHAKKRLIRFLSTPFDLTSLRLLTDRFGLETIKVPSGEITNAPLLFEVAQKAKSVILSTGMASLAEVEAALAVLERGFQVPAQTPGGHVLLADRPLSAVRERVTLLHCTTEYPAPFAEVNLRAMDTLAAAFGVPVGYSDHTPGIHVAIAAVARGARVIEKHFTLDRTMPGPDHRASLEPGELREMIANIRDVELTLGDGYKCATATEFKNRDVVRKSLVAARPIRAGERLSVANITCKRPGTGRSPFDYWRLLDQPANRDYAEDEMIDG